MTEKKTVTVKFDDGTTQEVPLHGMTSVADMNRKVSAAKAEFDELVEGAENDPDEIMRRLVKKFGNDGRTDK